MDIGEDAAVMAKETAFIMRYQKVRNLCLNPNIGMYTIMVALPLGRDVEKLFARWVYTFHEGTVSLLTLLPATRREWLSTCFRKLWT